MKNNRLLSAILAIGICVIAIGTFTDALVQIRESVRSISKGTVPLHEPIPEDQIPKEFEYGFEDPIEFSEITYSKRRGQLDVRVRNTSDMTVVLNNVYLHVEYEEYYGAGMPATDVVSVDVEDEVDRAKEEQEPLFLRKGYRVAYKIEPKGADRYLFDLPIDPDDLFYPPSPYDGEYEVRVTFSYNRGQFISESVSLEHLLREGRIVP
jgi:hypothetical protein